MTKDRLRHVLALVVQALPVVFLIVLAAMAAAALGIAAYVLGSIITAVIRIFEILTGA